MWDHVIVCDKGHPISFRTLGSGVKINRFPNTAAICRKDRLCTNFHAMQKKFGKKIFNFIPKVDREMLLSQFKEYFYLLLILSDLPPSRGGKDTKMENETAKGEHCCWPF